MHCWGLIDSQWINYYQHKSSFLNLFANLLAFSASSMAQPLNKERIKDLFHIQDPEFKFMHVTPFYQAFAYDFNQPATLFYYLDFAGDFYYPLEQPNHCFTFNKPFDFLTISGILKIQLIQHTITLTQLIKTPTGNDCIRVWNFQVYQKNPLRVYPQLIHVYQAKPYLDDQRMIPYYDSLLFNYWDFNAIKTINDTSPPTESITYAGWLHSQYEQPTVIGEKLIEQFKADFDQQAKDTAFMPFAQQWIDQYCTLNYLPIEYSKDLTLIQQRLPYEQQPIIFFPHVGPPPKQAAGYYKARADAPLYWVRADLPAHPKYNSQTWVWELRDYFISQTQQLQMQTVIDQHTTLANQKTHWL